MSVISVRPTPDLERKIKKLMEFEKAEKSSIVRRALEKGLDEELKKVALNLYIEKKVSLAKAAEIAEIDIRDMIKIIGERGISLNITVEDLRKDFEEAME
jgi:predicted HTH domain antitoxin